MGVYLARQCSVEPVVGIEVRGAGAETAAASHLGHSLVLYRVLVVLGAPEDGLERVCGGRWWSWRMGAAVLGPACICVVFVDHLCGSGSVVHRLVAWRRRSLRLVLGMMHLRQWRALWSLMMHMCFGGCVRGHGQGAGRGRWGLARRLFRLSYCIELLLTARSREAAVAQYFCNSG